MSTSTWEAERLSGCHCQTAPPNAAPIKTAISTRLAELDGQGSRLYDQPASLELAKGSVPLAHRRSLAQILVITPISHGVND